MFLQSSRLLACSAHSHARASAPLHCYIHQHALASMPALSCMCVRTLHSAHTLTEPGLVQGILELEASVMTPGGASASHRPHDQGASASNRRPHDGAAPASRRPDHNLSHGQGQRVGEQGRVAGKRGRPRKSDHSLPETTWPSKPLPSPPITAEPRQRALGLNALGFAGAGSSCVPEGNRGGGEAKGGFMGAGLSDTEM